MAWVNAQRVNSAIEKTEAFMKEAGKTYRYQKYPGAGHTCMRRGGEPEGQSKTERQGKIPGSVY